LISRLQRAAGNRAVYRLMHAVQPRPDVAPVDDEYEREADRVAENVMRMPEPQAPAPPRPLKSDDDEVEASFVQRHAAQNTAPDITTATAATIRGLNSGGAPLPDRTRAFFEPRFGADFGNVRIHATAEASEAARSIRAHAFTVGRNIAFAEGRYAPDSPEGRRLLAHELTHVVQQSGGLAAGDAVAAASVEPCVVQRQPDPRPSSKVMEPVELKGKSLFSPPPDVEERIKSRLGQPVSVAVKFGDLANSELPVIWNGLWYESGPPPANHDGHPLGIHHEGFPVKWGARPMLGINIEKSFVTGFVGWRTSAALARDPGKFFAQHPLSELFGWEGLITSPPLPTEGTNVLRGGKLEYFQPASFETGSFRGSASVSLKDEEYDFEGEIWVNEVKGINTPLYLKKEGEKLFADQTWKFERTLGPTGGKLSGEIIGTFAGGKPDVRGTLSYSRSKPKVSGTVTVLVTTFDIAKENVRDQLGPDAPALIEPAAPDDRLAITGWGHLDFVFNEWLTGNADVIVHPEGYVTAKGEIVPTVVIPILKKREAEDKPLFSGSISKALPGLDAVVADISLKGSLDITGYASFGPGTLHDLRVAGLFSTHPGIVNTFELSGIMSVPAIAGIKAVAKGGIVAQVWFGKKWEVARVGLTIHGDLALQLYAEAAAAAGRRKGDDGQPEYFLKGSIHGGAGLKLDLHMWLSGEVAFWSKHIELYNRTFTIADGSATIEFDYVIGGKKKKDEDALKLSVALGKFDADKFAEAVLRGETVEEKKYKGRQEADGSLTTQPNPDAPAPVQPPDPTKPMLPGAPTGVSKTLSEPFTMDGAPHTLKLTLSDPPGLTMQTVLEPLLKKIDRARKDLKKDTSVGDAEKATRLAALNKIEASANGVQAAAARVAKNPAYITPDIPGFDDLAKLIGAYGDAYDVTDLALALEKVIVDPSKPETVLHKFPGLAANELVVRQVARIIAAGVEATVLRKVVENVRPVKDDNVVELLGLIEKMINSGATNWDKVITDLRIGGNKFKGAIFVIRYIDSKLGWTDVGFELTSDPLNTSGRRWDAWVSGMLYQFKSWYSWPDVADRTFLRQILEDYHNTRVGEEMGLRWVFETSLTKDQIVKKMKDALAGVVADLKAGRTPKADGYTGGIALFIHARVESIVTVVKP
jgi:hypothetical protein